MSDSPPRRGWLSGIGPAIITASVVLGPGSILASSTIGYKFGYQMIWVLAFAVLLMVGMTALSARLGVMLDGTLCQELARRAGRPVAAFIGLTLFSIVACFQFGNNLGVLAAIEPFYDQNTYVPILIIVNLNLLVIVALFGFKALYLPAERLMKCLVGLMIVGFAGNLILARPDVWQVLAGLVPQFPASVGDRILPAWDAGFVSADGAVRGKVIDPFDPVTAMIGTTFSASAAFFQSYLVRQKGWTRNDLSQGLVDSAVGILTLGMMTMMIMVTAAAVLHGTATAGAELQSAADVALALEPAFGRGAVALFCLGIFAGAFSSILANAMIGGSILSDGLGLGGYIDQRWPKLFTVLAMAIGLNVAIFVQATGQRPMNLIIFAQAMTVLGMPILAGALLWLATRSDLTGERHIPLWMKLVACVALLTAVFVAVRMAARLLLPVFPALQNLLSV